MCPDEPIPGMAGLAGAALATCVSRTSCNRACRVAAWSIAAWAAKQFNGRLRSATCRVARHMVHAWNDGMASLRSPKRSVVFRGLDETIAQAGLSAPERADNGREVIGRSELLGRSGKR